MWAFARYEGYLPSDNPKIPDISSDLSLWTSMGFNVAHNDESSNQILLMPNASIARICTDGVSLTFIDLYGTEVYTSANILPRRQDTSLLPVSVDIPRQQIVSTFESNINL